MLQESVLLFLAGSLGENKSCAVLISVQELVCNIHSAIAGIYQLTVFDAELAIRCAMFLVICRDNEFLAPEQCSIGIYIHRNFTLRHASPFIYGHPAAVCSIGKYLHVAAFRFAVPDTIKLFECRLTKDVAGKENKQ